MEIKHFSHKHPLTLSEKKEDGGIECIGCKKCCSGPTYGCSLCNFFLHKSCAELPRKIEHFFHPDHNLTLMMLPYFMVERVCQACNQKFLGFAYCCFRCTFYMDIECALLPSRIESEGTELNQKIQYFGHGHPLTLALNGEADSDVLCSVCARSFSGESGSGTTYVCIRCSFFLHKSCLELPREIRHDLFHPRHPLTLVLAPSYDNTKLCCDACGNICSTRFTYCCRKCDFDLHIDCASLTTSVRYKGHQHPLVLIEKMCYHSRCDICAYLCKEFFIRCVQCDLNLHLHCHPSFPRTIKHECHIHRLTFFRFVSQEEQDEYTEFYCHACETERNPQDSFYYCAPCRFAAHIRCVISEILPPLVVEDESAAIWTNVPTEDPILAKIDEEIAMALAEMDSALDEQKKLEEKLQDIEATLWGLREKRTELVGKPWQVEIRD